MDHLLPRHGFPLTGQKLVLRELIVSCHIGVTEQERATSPSGWQLTRSRPQVEPDPGAPKPDIVEEVVDYGALPVPWSRGLHQPPRRAAGDPGRRDRRGLLQTTPASASLA